LAGNFNFQIFGSPFVGADICGFMGHTTPELCSRWIQIGALYPFSRNHNELQSRDQEPWAFGNDFKGELMTKTYRESVKLRYSILKWFYSLFILARGRGSVWKPLIFEFPKEEILYKENFNELQFLMGSHVMVTPVLDGGKVSVDAYFPIATWFNYYTGERFIEKSETDRKRLVAAPLGEAPPLWVREGYIMHS
jgi:alpha-glucosidase (family GH31 glycosyl hydrolase)